MLGIEFLPLENGHYIPLIGPRSLLLYSEEIHPGYTFRVHVYTSSQVEQRDTTIRIPSLPSFIIVTLVKSALWYYVFFFFFFFCFFFFFFFFFLKISNFPLYGETKTLIYLEKNDRRTNQGEIWESRVVVQNMLGTLFGLVAFKVILRASSAVMIFPKIQFKKSTTSTNQGRNLSSFF